MCGPLPFCLNTLKSCFNFGKLILRKIIKTAVTRCQYFLKLKCTKFNFGSTVHTRPHWGSYSTPDSLTGFKGSSTERKGEVREEGEARNGRGVSCMGGNVKAREGKGEGKSAYWAPGCIMKLTHTDNEFYFTLVTV